MSTTNIITKLRNAASRFSVTDFAVFKICLIVIGVLLGAYFSAFFMRHIAVVWIVAAVTYIAIMIRLIRNYRR